VVARGGWSAALSITEKSSFSISAVCGETPLPALDRTEPLPERGGRPRRVSSESEAIPLTSGGARSIAAAGSNFDIDAVRSSPPPDLPSSGLPSTRQISTPSEYVVLQRGHERMAAYRWTQDLPAPILSILCPLREYGKAQFF
jgi:hypothetical protein